MNPPSVQLNSVMKPSVPPSRRTSDICIVSPGSMAIVAGKDVLKMWNSLTTPGSKDGVDATVSFTCWWSVMPSPCPARTWATRH